MSRTLSFAFALAVVLALAGVASAGDDPAPQPPSSAAGAPARPHQAPVQRPPRSLKDPFEAADMEMVAPNTPPRPVIVVSPEIAKVGRQLAGTYTCKGVSLRGDGSSTPLEAKVTVALALDNAWIVMSFVATNAGGMKFTDYRTFDGVAKQWSRVQLASTSGHAVSTSLGEKDGTWTWEGTESSPLGTAQIRDHEQVTGKQLKVWGEAQLSGSWQKLYEATCKR